MGERALAHIEKIVKTYPIEGADKIEMAQVLDFHVVVKKGEFKSGDIVVYIEVDSILPDGLSDSLKAELNLLKKSLKNATEDEKKVLEEKISEIVSKNSRPEFEFLRQKKFVIKCLKYNFDNGFGGKIVSMGIIFPTSILPMNVTPEIGLDVTEVLSIQKVVEDPEELNVSEDVDNRSNFEKFLDKKFNRYKLYRKMKKKFKGERLKGSWDDWLPKPSDETNVQNIYSKFVERNGRTGYYTTLKCEGQNFSIYNRYSKTMFGLRKKMNFGICSHYKNLVTDDGSHFWNAANRLKLREKLSKVDLEIVVRGELMGPKICGNIYGLTEFRYFVFEIFDPINKRLYTFDEMIEFCNKYGFETVPVIDFDYTLPETVQEILEYSNRKDELVPGKLVQSEGIVIRKKNDLRISTKARSPVYLSKDKK